MRNGIPYLIITIMRLLLKRQDNTSQIRTHCKYTSIFYVMNLRVTETSD